MKIHNLILSCLTAIVIVGGGAYCTAVGVVRTQEAQAAHDLNRWTDQSQASSKGEGVEYIKAVAEAAKALNGLSIRDLRARVLPHVEALEEEARWTNFIVAMLPVDCIRELPRQSIINDIPRQQGLVGMNLANIKLALEPGTDRMRLQEAIVQVEHELPTIKQGRQTMADNFLVQVLGSSVIRTDVTTAEEIKEMLAKD